MADSPKTPLMNPSYGVRIADTVATHHTSWHGSTGPRTGLDVPMIRAQSSNAIVDVWNEHTFPLFERGYQTVSKERRVPRPATLATDVQSYSIVYI
jgi:hypothetical protein